ncbi:MULTISPECIES: sensor histidine kinase [Pseudomonadati]|uniref:histidine kinase n=1 Tax=Shewanella aestuarii TaxID=1028752 RepID=A0ABT0L2U2_9GAMM|nr:ATP-binding protein [Shewanella aestuarii]MCL1118013.1 HAMP domain-containing histidine kinase [Shewanella aestuarii]GGN79469.1 two-component sensor histidine kinase [Shewanella aestuarii]
MKSLASSLVNRMTWAVLIIVILIFLVVDIIIDNWIDTEFDNALMLKSNYLKTLIKVSPAGVEFDFAGEFMPEFTLPAKGEYFQLWQDGAVFERSESLVHFGQTNLIKVDLPINGQQFFDVTLPDGRSGRAMVSVFEPQVPDKYQSVITGNIAPMVLTVALSEEELNHILIIIDSSLAVGLLLVILFMRWAVVKLIHRGLQPLNELNQALKNIDFQQTELQLPNSFKAFIEIEPVKNELNKFIRLNHQHLQNEKRITADIAHELKTPISELISLSEIYIRYPQDERIGVSYKQDVLAISLKMKDIVNNLLLLQKASSEGLQLNQTVIDIEACIAKIVAELNASRAGTLARVNIISELVGANCQTDEFSLHTVLYNLIDNALFYSPQQSKVVIRLVEQKQPGHNNKSEVGITIENELLNSISQDDLERLTLPLFQTEKSRQHQNRHGLGLAIVDNIAQVNQYHFSFGLVDSNRIAFTFSLPKITS